jgi:hypothetical protein
VFDGNHCRASLRLASGINQPQQEAKGNVIIEVAGWSHYRYVACKILTSIVIGALHRVDAERGALLKPSFWAWRKATGLRYVVFAPLDYKFIACKRRKAGATDAVGAGRRE